MATRIRGRLPAALLLATVVLAAVSLSLAWVFLVPIYQSPDEPQHLDYALSIAERRGLIRPDSASLFTQPERRAVATTEYVFLSTDGGPVAFEPRWPWNYVVHPSTHHLLVAARTGAIARWPRARVPEEYGTPPFYAAVDSGAAAHDSSRALPPPSLLSLYPFGYYALLAAWIEVLRSVRDSLVFIFFGARILSVLLLGGSLVLMYATMREMALGRPFALLLVAIVGHFPLTSFVSSYVQPDNLALTLVSLCLYLALVARRNLGDRRVLGLLGVALGGLAVTKVHVYVAVAVAVFGALLSEMGRRPGSRRRWAGDVALLVLPTMLFWAVHVWTVWSVPQRYARPPALGADPAGLMLPRFTRAVLEYYAGQTHRSFWGTFGWLDTPIVVVDGPTTALVQGVILWLTWITLAMTIIRLGGVSGRLLAVARRGRRGTALRMALSNSVINSYFVFTAVMVLIFLLRGSGFAPQGRNWLPMVLPAFLTAIAYAPKVLPRRIRSTWSTAVVTGLALYAIVGAYFALQSVAERYYAKPALAALHTVVSGLVRYFGG